MVFGIIAVGVMVVSLLPATALAGNQLCPPNAPPAVQNSEVCRNQSDPIAGPGGIVSDVTNVVAVVGGLVAVFMIIYGGFKFITSTGDSSKVQEAKKTIMWSAIGLVVIVMARTIIVFVLEKV